jgi:hypothetical protein
MGIRVGQRIQRPGGVVATRLVVTVLVSTVVLLAGLAGVASARTVNFVPQFTPEPFEHSTFSVTGNRISSLSAIVGARYCSAPAVPPNADDDFRVQLLAGAHDPFESGCSGSYSFVAIPNVSSSTGPANRSAYQSHFVDFGQFVDFDYASGVIRNLRIDANFECGPSVDQADVNAKAYGFATLRTTASGRFSMKDYVFDEYNRILSFKITGMIDGAKASGRIVVTEPRGGFTGVGGVACAGNSTWTATKPAHR